MFFLQAGYRKGMFCIKHCKNELWQKKWLQCQLYKWTVKATPIPVSIMHLQGVQMTTCVQTYLVLPHVSSMASCTVIISARQMPV